MTPGTSVKAIPPAAGVFTSDRTLDVIGPNASTNAERDAIFPSANLIEAP
jgi:hypothetical protein